jgi:hypothetical protein
MWPLVVHAVFPQPVTKKLLISLFCPPSNTFQSPDPPCRPVDMHNAMQPRVRGADAKNSTTGMQSWSRSTSHPLFSRIPPF